MQPAWCLSVLHNICCFMLHTIVCSLHVSVLFWTSADRILRLEWVCEFSVENTIVLFPFDQSEAEFIIIFKTRYQKCDRILGVASENMQLAYDPIQRSHACKRTAAYGWFGAITCNCNSVVFVNVPNTLKSTLSPWLNSIVSTARGFVFVGQRSHLWNSRSRWYRMR